MKKRKYLMLAGIFLIILGLGLLLINNYLRSERYLVYVQEHCQHEEWRNGACVYCGSLCEHLEWEDGHCTQCGLACDHKWENSKCTICGTEFRAWGSRILTACCFPGGTCEGSWRQGTSRGKNTRNGDTASPDRNGSKFVSGL